MKNISFKKYIFFKTTIKYWAIGTRKIVGLLGSVVDPE